MNRTVTSAAGGIAIAALAFVLATPSPAPAQPSQPDAATVVAWVQAFYDQTQTMSARFVQRYVNRVYQRTVTSRGRVRFRKPGMMRFDYDEPNGKVIVSDASNLVVYEPPDAPGGRGQHFEQPIGQAQLPAALSFLTGTGRLDEDFRFRLLDASALSYSGQIVELRSRRPTPHYSRIILFVDDDEAHRGVVHRIVIIDSANNRNRFDFTNQDLNSRITEQTFRWRPPANSRRIQP